MQIVIGAKVGKWSVLGLGTKDRQGRKRWICRCECGLHRQVGDCPLSGALSTSCGRHEQKRKIVRTTTAVCQVCGDTYVLPKLGKNSTTCHFDTCEKGIPRCN